MYIYLIRGDGEWINTQLEAYDAKLNAMGHHPIHADMRAFKSGLQRIMKDRYEKKNFLKEYGPILIPILAVVVILIGSYFIISKVVASQDNLNKGIEASKEVMVSAKQIIASLDNICSNSGIKPAGGA